MIKLVVFDLDGTLLDTIDDLLDSINDVADKHGYNVVNKDYFYSCIGNGQRFLIDHSFNGISDVEYNELLQDYLCAYESRFMNKTRPFKEIKHLLSKLDKSGYKLGVLSNKKDNQVKSLIGYYFPEFKFDFVNGAEVGIPLKPNPLSILNCINNSNILPSETVMIGDSYQDALTANNAGICSISVLWGYQSKDTIKQYSNPEFFAENCNELFDLILSLNEYKSMK